MLRMECLAAIRTVYGVYCDYERGVIRSGLCRDNSARRCSRQSGIALGNRRGSARGLVDVQRDVRAGGPRLDEMKPRHDARIGEQPLALAENDWVHHQPI